MRDVGQSVWRSHDGEVDEFFITCPGPAPNASRLRRDLARILLCDTTTVVVVFSSLVARAARSFEQ
jgi:hypothetical protein